MQTAAGITIWGGIYPPHNYAGRIKDAGYPPFSAESWLEICSWLNGKRKRRISAVNEYEGDEMLNLLLVDDRIPAGAKLY